MKKYYLGLGSNLGNRKENIEKAISLLRKKLNSPYLKSSAIYETPALLKSLKFSDWNKPFLNAVIELDSEIEPENLLQITQLIEYELGRVSPLSERIPWSPRDIDIDILLMNDNKQFNSKGLCIPHPEIEKRAFVLDPLKDLRPLLILPSGESVLSKSRRLPQHSPLWMAVINSTPDSFSQRSNNVLENKSNSLEQDWQKYLMHLIDQDIGIIDIGGESTRPDALEVSEAEEWQRVHPFLNFLKKVLEDREIRPKLSIDTRHFSTAKKALNLGVNIINDVSGLADERFISLIKETDCEYILMHSLSVPANPDLVINNHDQCLDEILLWFKNKIQLLEKSGVSREKIIIDPGVGFGKTGLQSQFLLKNIEHFYNFDCRVLVGHSRKSFMNVFTNLTPYERDIETLGISLALIQKGIDIIRVHDFDIHKRAFQAWSHVQRDEE